MLGLFEMEPIGDNGALEAVTSHPFCSESCRNAYADVYSDVEILRAGTHEVTVDEPLYCEYCNQIITERAQ